MITINYDNEGGSAHLIEAFCVLVVSEMAGAIIGCYDASQLWWVWCGVVR